MAAVMPLVGLAILAGAVMFALQRRRHLQQRRRQLELQHSQAEAEMYALAARAARPDRPGSDPS